MSEFHVVLTPSERELLVRMLTDATNRLNEVFARVERDLANPGEY